MFSVSVYDKCPLIVKLGLVMQKDLEEQMKPTQAKSRWFHYKDKRVVYSFCIIGVLCVNSLCRRCTPLFFLYCLGLMGMFIIPIIGLNLRLQMLILLVFWAS